MFIISIEEDINEESIKYLSKNIKKLPNIHSKFKLCSNLSTDIYKILIKHYYSDSCEYKEKEINKLELSDCEKIFLYSTDDRLIKIYLYLICVHVRELQSIIDSFSTIKLSDLLGIIIRIFNKENNDKLFFLMVSLCLDYPISFEFIQNQINFSENEIQQKIFFSIRSEYTIDLTGVCIGKKGVKYICHNISLLPNLQNLFFCYNDVYPEGIKYLKKQIDKIPNLYLLFNLCSHLDSYMYSILLKYYTSTHYYIFDCIYIDIDIDIAIVII